MKRPALRCAVVAILSSGACLASFAQDVAGKRPITFDDLRSMHRVTSPTISPDGKWVAYSITRLPDMVRRLCVTMRLAHGCCIFALPRQVLARRPPPSAPCLSAHALPLQKLACALPRGGGGSPGIACPWLPGRVSLQVVLFLLLAVCARGAFAFRTRACNSARDGEKQKNKVKARVYEQLLYRHWTHWSEGKRSHLFVAPADGGGTPRDLTAGANYDVPPDERGEAEDINFSPDGKEICFTAIPDKVEALSTNGELFIAPVSGGEAKKITTNPGFDGNPVYSPDGNYIAYHAQLTPGYEADRWRVMRYDRHTEKIEDLTEKFDRSAAGLEWSPDSKTIYFIAENETLSPIYALDSRGGAEPKKVVAEGFIPGLDEPRWKDHGVRAHQPDDAG